MFTTLDAKPQEWMEGDSDVLHTVAACHFNNLEHAEYWINQLVPRNQNGELVKWAGGRRKDNTRDSFIDNCLNNADKLDFQINCVSSSEGEMSWFAWAFYFQNKTLVSQRTDSKNRNCLVFSGIGDSELSFPVLRAGYLIWYNHVIRYLTEFKKITGKFLSDNFCNDEVGPGEGKALGVAFVNYLLKQAPNQPQISLPVTNRFRQCDLISDYFCGWINSVRSGSATSEQEGKLNELENHEHKLIDNIMYAANLTITDENGTDVTSAVKGAVTKGSADG